MSKLVATFNAVIVKPQEEEESMYGSIVVPDLGKEKVLTGTIVTVGEGHYSVTGNFIPTMLKVGQKVILPLAGPSKIEFEGEEYFTIPENQVLAIIED